MPKPAPPPLPESPLISPRWLIGALALALLFAALCGYAALCLLFYQGQWQLLFHPSRTITATPASVGIAYQETHFAVSYTGPPLLDGWNISATPGAKYVTDTVLYLHDAHGSLSDCVPQIATLHAAGINVFAVDYRGFGRSAWTRPTERSATQDAINVWVYLTDQLQIPPGHLIVFGDGAGAIFAAHIAAQFAPAGVILEDPSPTARQIYLSDPRARLLPLWLLQNQKLDPAPDLAATHVPRLFLNVRGNPRRTRELFDASSYPKQYFDLRRAPDSALPAALTRFFDNVLR